MDRFELEIFFIETKDNNVVGTNECNVVCSVNDINNFDEVNKKAHKVIRLHIDKSDNLILVGSATVIIGKVSMFSFGFRNKNVPDEIIDEVLEFFEMSEEERVLH